MANCQITPQSGSKNTEDVAAIPEGRVGRVCKEWLIREDGNLAYRLQNEEITQHYNENRSKNQIVRKDIPLAKHLQHNEIIEAQRKYERLLKEQQENDEKLARKIERKLLLEEEAAKRATEEADERLAKKLMEKEKAKQMKKRLEKEKQQVEKLSAQLGVDYPVKKEPGEQTLRFSRPSFQRIMTEDEQELDLSEFCMPPPPGLTPEELKYFIEEQDAEIARLLQHQELKRSRNPEKEKLAAIEAQDHAIAKMLQKMEKERFKRIKEKLRNQRSQSSDNDFRPENLNYQRTSTPLNSLEVDQNKPENDYDIPENHLLMQNHHEQTYEEPYLLMNQQTEPKLTQSFHNIAIDLDPTYKRRSKLQSSSQSNLIESCVDDEDRIRSESNSGSNFVSRFNYRDSLEKLHPSIGNRLSSTSSSRSSRTSSASHNSIHKSELFNPEQEDPQPPPLPPRDVSLMSQHNKNPSSSNGHQATTREFIKSSRVDGTNPNLLPPHHPQHPNRQLKNDSARPFSYTHHAQTTSSAPIPGQRRMISMERPPVKEKSAKNPDGCKTQ